MITLKEALKIVEMKLKEESLGHTLVKSYGEVPDKYVFDAQDINGMIPPGGGHWTVHKETGECKFEYLERENWTPERRFPRSYAPIKGYKKIELRE